MNTFIEIGIYQLVVSAIFFITKQEPSLIGLFIGSFALIFVGLLIRIFTDGRKDG